MCGKVLDQQVYFDPGGRLPAGPEGQADQQIRHAVGEIAADQRVRLDGPPGKVEAAEVRQSAVSCGEVCHHIAEIAGIVQQELHAVFGEVVQ